MFYNQSGATNTSRDKKFSGNAALGYIFDSGLAPYLSYVESFQPGTGADDIGSNEMFKPTGGKQWGLGVEYQPVGSDSLFTAAVYDLRQENARVTDNVNGAPTTPQAGEVKVTGSEPEATSNVTDNLKVIGSHSYTDVEVKKGQYAGNRLQQASRNQTSLWADYTWYEDTLNGSSVGAGARHIGSTCGDQANIYNGHAGSYTLYDAVVRYDPGQLNGSLKGISVAINANNLFNKDYLASYDGYYRYYGSQRSVVGSVSCKW